jgi:serine/threonine protein kinase
MAVAVKVSLIAIACRERRCARQTIRKNELDDDERRCLRQELSVLRLLGRHPNLIRLLDVFDEEDCVYIVTELLAGGTLLDLLGPPEENIAFSRTRTRRIISQLLCGVEALHDVGIVHRDLKPNNIWYCAHARACVCVCVFIIRV